MAKWRLSTSIKKCVSEYQVYEKDGERIVLEYTWRWGNVSIETEDDTPPDIDLSDDADVDVTCIDNSEINMLEDNCASTIRFPESMEDDEELQEEFNEDMYEWLDSNGWECIDTEIYFEGPLTLERIG